VTAVQAEYSLFTRDLEGPDGTNLLATCRELGVAVVVNSPLGRGLLTTTFNNSEPLGDAKDRRTQVSSQLFFISHLAKGLRRKDCATFDTSMSEKLLTLSSG
jgi:aryl-alcohol dehydrogenase-like predicted oxidoreductase